MLLALASRSFQGGRTIVFFKTKQRAHRAKLLFGLAGLAAAGELHGDMTQAARLESLEKFRKVREWVCINEVYIPPCMRDVCVYCLSSNVPVTKLAIVVEIRASS